MMKVTVKLFATLRKGRFDIETMKYSPGTRISRLIHELNIPQDQVFIIFVNNRHSGPDRQLHDGDVVAFFPPIGGG